MGGSFAETDEDDVSTLSGELAVFIVVDAALFGAGTLPRRSTCCSPAASRRPLRVIVRGVVRASPPAVARGRPSVPLPPAAVARPPALPSRPVCSYCPGASCSTRAGRPRWARVRWRACSSSGGCGSSGRSAPAADDGETRGHRRAVGRAGPLLVTRRAHRRDGDRFHVRLRAVRCMDDDLGCSTHRRGEYIVGACRAPRCARSISARRSSPRYSSSLPCAASATLRRRRRIRGAAGSRRWCLATPFELLPLGEAGESAARAETSALVHALRSRHASAAAA